MAAPTPASAAAGNRLLCERRFCLLQLGSPATRVGAKQNMRPRRPPRSCGGAMASVATSSGRARLAQRLSDLCWAPAVWCANVGGARAVRGVAWCGIPPRKACVHRQTDPTVGQEHCLWSRIAQCIARVRHWCKEARAEARSAGSALTQGTAGRRKGPARRSCDASPNQARFRHASFTWSAAGLHSNSVMWERSAMTSKKVGAALESRPGRFGRSARPGRALHQLSLAAQPLHSDLLPGGLDIQGAVEAALREGQGGKRRAGRKGGAEISAAPSFLLAGLVCERRQPSPAAPCSQPPPSPKGARTRRFMYCRAARVLFTLMAPASSCFLP